MLDQLGGSWNQSAGLRICRKQCLESRRGRPKGTDGWRYTPPYMTAKPPVPDSPPRASSTADSPCVAVCSTLFDDICRGCGRTAMEVANWVMLSDEEKQAVWQRIRAQGYPRRKG